MRSLDFIEKLATKEQVELLGERVESLSQSTKEQIESLRRSTKEQIGGIRLELEKFATKEQLAQVRERVADIARDVTIIEKSIANLEKEVSGIRGEIVSLKDEFNKSLLRIESRMEKRVREVCNKRTGQFSACCNSGTDQLFAY